MNTQQWEEYVGPLRPSFAVQMRDSWKRAMYADIENVVTNAIWEPAVPRERAAILALSLAETLENHAIVIWSEEMFNAAEAGHEAFSGSPLDADEAAIEPQLWVFDDFTLGLDGELFALPAGHQNIQAVILSPVHGASNISSAVADGFASAPRLTGRRGIRITYVFIIPDAENNARFYLRALPSVYNGDDLDHSFYRRIRAALRFLTLPFIAERPLPLPRQQVRARARRGEEPADVRVVVLRREPEAEPSDATPGGHVAVEWSCQWFVRGHWRRLREPRKSDGALQTYVAPYVKGPAEKPLKTPAEPVYVVVR